LFTTAACSRADPDEAASVEPVSVAVQEARLDTLRDAVSSPGLVVPSTAGDWTVYVHEPAEIVELPKHEGEEVAVGDLLVRFQFASLTQEIAASELGVLEATADVQRARDALAQSQRLFDRGMIARLQHEARQADLANAESRLRQATGRFEAVKGDEVKTVVRARFPGTIVNVWHAAGDALTGSASDPILRVVDRSRVQVAVQLPILQVARIVPGQLATVRSFGSEASELATVASRAETNDPTVATAEVRLSFAQPATLPVETPVSVEIVLDQRTGVVVVPTSAIMNDSQGDYVVIAGTDQRAHRRDVRVGLRTRDLAHIVTGLTAGERVIVAGAGDVGEGTAIAVSR
jgi:RND family efflux transporter MFP subunit